MRSIKTIVGPVLIAMVLVACGSDSTNPTPATKALPTITDGLLVYLPLDGSVVDSKDLIPNSSISISGGPSYVTDHNGKPNKALRLDGMDDLVQLGSITSIQELPLTWSAWLRPGFTTQSGLTVPVGKYLHPSGDGIIFFWENGRFGGIYTAMNFARYCRAETPTSFRLDGAWHHVAMSVDSVRMLLYVDGVKASDWSWTGRATTPVSTEQLTIGNVRSVHPNQPPVAYQGDIDDIAIYGRVLSPAEILILAKQ